MKLIANADRCWGIGRNGDMLFHIPEDLRFFRAQTTGGAVIMGRRTLASLPGGRPLRDRLNIVLTRDDTVQETDSLRVCRSIEEAVREASAIPDSAVYVIGGSEVYRQMLGMCSEALITRVDADGHADCFMPNLDAAPEWTLRETLREGVSADGISYRFLRYVRTP